MKRLILASASPRRRELLRQAGFTFEVVAPEVDETYPGGEDPAAFAERLALAKAAQIAQRFTAKDDVVVLGADTVVVADGEVLGKPVSADDARAMLRKLSGIAHRVITGVALAAQGRAARFVTRVEGCYFNVVGLPVALVDRLLRDWNRD